MARGLDVKTTPITFAYSVILMNNDLPLSMYVSNLWLPHVAMAERLAFWEEPKRWLNQRRARDTFCLKFSNKIRMLDFKGEFVGGIENSILIKKLYITAPTLGKHSLNPGIVTYPVKTRIPTCLADQSGPLVKRLRQRKRGVWREPGGDSYITALQWQANDGGLDCTQIHK